LKWAQTRDGFIDIIRNSQSAAKPNWITNQFARMMVHKWRSEEQAILVGTNTALNDNPKLNVRDWHGNNPLRVLIDRTLRLPQNLHLFDGSLPTLIITEKNEKDHNSRNIIYNNTVFDGYLPEKILAELYRRNIQSVFIEGGAKLIQSFINAGLWDEARVFTGPVDFEKGIPAPTIQSENIKIESWSGFTLHIYRNSSI
jgi:diaminohydroxyphosphoribosylaminopyrimidine deaminase/5-amino-6-(5-phosphoribosylamino)uracil reductase